MVGDLGEWLGWGFATWAITYIIAWAQFEKGKRFFCNMIKLVKLLQFNCLLTYYTMKPFNLLCQRIPIGPNIAGVQTIVMKYFI